MNHICQELRIKAILEEHDMASSKLVYLIAAQWWSEWESFIEEGINAPSEIDNFTLVENYTLRTDLETEDFKQLPHEAWSYLHYWYGGGPEIVVFSEDGVPNLDVISVRFQVLDKYYLDCNQWELLFIPKDMNGIEFRKHIRKKFQMNTEPIIREVIHEGCLFTLKLDFSFFAYGISNGTRLVIEPSNEYMCDVSDNELEDQRDISARGSLITESGNSEILSDISQDIEERNDIGESKRTDNELKDQRDISARGSLITESCHSENLSDISKKIQETNDIEESKVNDHCKDIKMKTFTSTTVNVRSDRNAVEQRITQSYTQPKLKLTIKPMLVSAKGLQSVWRDYQTWKNK